MGTHIKNGKNYSAGGLLPLTIIQTLQAGSTSVVFTDPSITNAERYNFYVEDQPLLKPTNAAFSNHTITLTFPEQEEAVRVKLVINENTNTYADSNVFTVTTFEVSTTGWEENTTIQPGTTLYQKQIMLTKPAARKPDITVGAAPNAVLPTAAQQVEFDRVKYVTWDDEVPCLYLYSTQVPESAYYIEAMGCE